ncbi:TIGR03085 family metal-binding protein [uncultured Friedmanniella sp.]|uniref:TIGR03085 family metal-binding protein n=1 Tax=uncultured Friedmanniella sp. TaxID=335381 RepID=UPI0035CB5E85
MGWARTEKNALVDTLRRTDPGADTLCTGWSTRRLLAHLVVREQDVLASLGDAVGRAEPGEEKYLGRLVDGAQTPEGYAALVDRFVAGPPRWSPMSWATEQINLLEYVVHHEDVRRGGTSPAEPRTLPPAQDKAVWKQLPLVSRLGFRRSPVPVVLTRPDGATARVGARRQDAGGEVVLTGEPVELALYVMGRRAAAHVQVSGPPAAVDAFQSWVAST